MPQISLVPESAARWLRRLDAFPAGWSWGLSLGAGLLAGILLTGLAPTWIGAFGVLLLLAGAVALAASGEPIAVLVERTEPRSSAPSLVELVSIPGGRFKMGSPEGEEGRFDDEGPVREVRVSPFACMRVPVTRRVYAAVMGEDPGEPTGEADERSVNNVSWIDAVRFCNRLSQREGLSPCYRIDDTAVSWDVTADGYRLLTEAEWEYACRAGSTGRWSFGEEEALLLEYAWFGANSKGESHPVGQLKPNAWGLYDLHGNVWEWCWDRYGRYPQRAEADPAGPEEGDSRVLRGGSFLFNSPRYLRSALRLRNVPSNRNWLIGFRCGRGSRRQP